jgi:acyl-CoA thioester hydrolase
MNFPVKLPLRLDWSEMDLFGHINNVSYFKYIQASRVNYWEVIGLTQLHGEMNMGPLLAATSCNFIKPLFYPGDIVVECSVEFMKTTSFGIHHRILNAAGEIAAEAHDVIVMYDFKAHAKIAIPGFLRDKIQELEGRVL